MQDKSVEYFVNKEKALFAAHGRAKKLLEDNLKILPDWHCEWDFNLLHDLVERIEKRILELQSDYRSWHFRTHGWAAIA